jgi:hypothetical protein
MWKLLFQSVQGTSHRRRHEPCQDRCRVRLRHTQQGAVLVLACADGAGSARLADLGAQQACRSILNVVLDDLSEGLTVRAVERDTVLAWHLHVRRELQALADAQQVVLQDLACTLLLAVVGETAAVFSQIGDGAIVTLAGDRYEPVFWPQRGEYANTTNFVTDADWLDLLAVSVQPVRVPELALFTDGLQMLALNFAGRTVHAPFFAPMFQRLRAARPGEGLPQALRQFLSSEAVNSRSDDDKTLILATRVPACASETHPL